MNQFHKIISMIFIPLLVPTYGVALIMNTEIFTSIYPLVWKIIAIIGTLLFTFILPSLPIFIMYKRGMLSNLYVSKKEERTLPYLFAFMGQFFWVMFLWRVLQLPTFIVAMAGGSVLSTLVVAFINLKWKISAHLSGMGGIVGGIAGISHRMGFNPVWMMSIAIVCSLLVAISRIELKAHTPLQTLAGFTQSFILVFAPSIFIH